MEGPPGRVGQLPKIENSLFRPSHVKEALIAPRTGPVMPGMRPCGLELALADPALALQTR